MTMSSASFNERLRRIEKSQAGGKMVLHVGDSEWSVKSLDDITKKIAVEAPKARLSLGKMIWALLFGAVAVIGGTAMRNHLMPLEAGAQLDDMHFLISGAFAFALSFVLAQVFRLRSKVLIVLQVLAIVAGLSTLHNLAFWQPALSAQAFSVEWVELQRAQAVENSVMFRDTVIPF